MSIRVYAEVEVQDIAYDLDREEAFDLIVRITENIADTSFDERIIAMLKEG